MAVYPPFLWCFFIYKACSPVVSHLPAPTKSWYVQIIMNLTKVHIWLISQRSHISVPGPKFFPVRQIFLINLNKIKKTTKPSLALHGHDRITVL